MIDLPELIALLDLKPLPGEGGFFRQTYVRQQGEAPPETTAILYLVTPQSFSALHRLNHDELFHFYLGDPCEMVTFTRADDFAVTALGHDLRAGMKVQHLVPAGVWQGTKLRVGGRFALLGTTMTPGYDPDGFALATEGDLVPLQHRAREKARSLLAHLGH